MGWWGGRGFGKGDGFCIKSMKVPTKIEMYGIVIGLTVDLSCGGWMDGGRKKQIAPKHQGTGAIWHICNTHNGLGVLFCEKQLAINPVTLRAKTALLFLCCVLRTMLTVGRNRKSTETSEEEETIKARTRWMQPKRAPAGLQRPPDDNGRSNTASQRGRGGEIYPRPSACERLIVGLILCFICRFKHTHTHTQELLQLS